MFYGLIMPLGIFQGSGNEGVVLLPCQNWGEFLPGNSIPDRCTVIDKYNHRLLDIYILFYDINREYSKENLKLIKGQRHFLSFEFWFQSVARKMPEKPGSMQKST